jgi:Peptidase family M28
MQPIRPRSPALACALALLATAACAPAAGPAPSPAPTSASPVVRMEDVREGTYALAHDSMQGRFTGAPGMWRAARYIAGELAEIGLEPAGDSGYVQRMPLAMEPNRRGIMIPRLQERWADTASVPADRRRVGVNVVGILRGSDPAMANEAVLIDAHYDHLGVGRGMGADSIFNGADDDASGVVTVIEIARALARGPRPKRTVIFLLTTGEEVGLLGTRWYIANPVIPLDRTVANMEIEMIGRPDSLAGGPGKAWLTGYERSTMGEMLAAAGIPIVADPRPDQNFFERSDNIAFARLGMPAHTLSSFNLHSDYHTPGDGPEKLDYAHMTQVIEAAVRATRLLTDGPAPQWKPGGRPSPEPEG